MTLFLETPASTDGTRPSTFTTTWTAVEPGLWSASTPGDFVGTVERLVDGRYLAVDGFGTPRGACATLAEAKARVMRPAGPAPRG